MRLVEAQAIARGIIRVDPGEDLLTALESLARAASWEEAIVTGAGVLELSELRAGNGEKSTYERAEIIALGGRITRSADGRVDVALHAMLLTESGPQSGRVLGAVTGPLSLVVDAVVGAQETARPRTPATPTPRPPIALPPAPPPAPASEPERPSPATPTSALHVTTDAADARLRTGPIATPKRPPVSAVDHSDDDDEEDGTADIQPGDILDHPQFGRCTVLGEDSSGGTRVRAISGRNMVLRLEALRVLPAALDPDGQRVFKVSGPRR